MSGKGKADLEAWEQVSGPADGHRGGTYTDRLKVTGGWLYRVSVWDEQLQGLALTFVPSRVSVEVVKDPYG